MTILAILKHSAINRLTLNVSGLCGPLLQVNSMLAMQMSETSAHSYLSKNDLNSRFYRSLAATFPELLDVLCDTSSDERHLQRVSELQKSLKFLSRALQRLWQYDTHVHSAINEWHLAPLIAFLTVATE